MIRSRRSLSAPMVLTLIGLGAFVTALDQTVVVTALPSVMLDLKIPITELDRAAWIITAYLLGYTVAMPLIGRLGDVYGFSTVYKAGLVVFAIGTSLVAASTSLEWMVVARVIQAVGGGAMVPLGMAIAVTVLPLHQRGLALGIVGAAAEAGSMLGPAYGGVIVELSSWRWIFWLNVPQSAVLFVALLWLPNQVRRGTRVDYTGGLVLMAALVLLSLGLSRQGLFTLDSGMPFVIAGSGLVLAVALVVLERRTWQPLLEPALFRSLAFVSANLTQLLVGITLIIAMITVPLMADTVMGKKPFTGALWLLRMTAAIPVGALVGGLVVGRIGVRPVTVVGLGAMALGLFLASTWDLGVGEPELTLHLVLAGLGFGLVVAPIATRAISSATDDYRATAASLVVVARMMGMTLGLAALAAWGVEHFQVLTAGLDFPLPQPGQAPEILDARRAEYTDTLTAAGLSLFHSFFRAAAVVGLVAILPALAMAPDRRG